MSDQILVSFQGEGSGVEDLTWGQIGLWQSIEGSGDSRTLGGVNELPPGTAVGDVAETLRFVMSRHQALRSRLLFEPDGTPRQVCASSGEIALEIVDASDADPAEVAEEVKERYQRKHFDYENEWPVRMAVVRRRGVPTHIVAVYLHLAIDATGMTVLLQDIGSRDRRTGDAAPVTAMQPLEQARRQRSAAAQRQCAASLRHLEHVLRTVPASRFGEPRPGREPEFRMIRYRSPATLLAARAIGARESVTIAPVLLASFAVALARFTGSNPVLALVMVNNRFRPGFADTVSAVAQITPLMVDVADLTVTEAIGRAAQSALNAYKNAYYDPYRQDEVLERVERERGEQIDLSCYYNDRRLQLADQRSDPVPTPQEIRDALGRGTEHWEDDVEMPRAKLYLHVDDPPGAVDFVLSVDTRFFSPADMQALVRGMESVAVEAALDPSATTAVRSGSTTPACSSHI